jgi:hypothetical protein
MISKNQRFGQHLVNELKCDHPCPEVFYVTDARVREIMGRWDWLRLVPGDVLEDLDQTYQACADEFLSLQYSDEYPVWKAIKAELTRREKEPR